MADLTNLKATLTGTKTPVTTTAEMKSALGTLYDFLTELLGTDSANKAAARELLATPGAAGLRNLIDNGDFRINQRAWVSGTAATSANQYCLDRWRIVTSGHAITWAADGAGFIVTAPAGGVEQLIDASSVVGGTYGVDWDGTATCTVNGQAVSKGGTVTLTANAQAAIRFSGGTVTRARLEPGKALPWETRPRWLEQLICMTYYEQPTSVVRVYAGASGTKMTVRYRVPKRVTPTVTFTANVGISTTPDAASNATQLTVAVTQASAGIISFIYRASADLT